MGGVILGWQPPSNPWVGTMCPLTNHLDFGTLKVSGELILVVYYVYHASLIFHNFYKVF